MTAQPNAEYLYVSVRNGKKVGHEYYGRGPHADFKKESRKLQHADVAAERAVNHREKELWQRAFVELRSTRQLVELFIDALMLAAGMRRAARHFWRGWRNGRRWLAECRGTGRPAKRPIGSPKSSPEPTGLLEIRQFVSWANSGDATALPRIRELLESDPAIWQYVNGRLHSATGLWQKLAAVEASAVREIEQEVHELRSRLLGDSTTEARKIVVSFVVLLWLVREWADVRKLTMKRPTWHAKRLVSQIGNSFNKWRRLHRRLKWLLPAIRPWQGKLSLFGTPERV